MSFDDDLQWGQEAERRVGESLLTKGMVLYTGEAKRPGTPGGGKIYSRKQATTLPDLQLIVDGKVSWYEVKRKSTPVFHRISQTWRHGIDLDLYDAYRRVEFETHYPVHLVVVEESGPDDAEGQVLCIALERVGFFGEKAPSSRAFPSGAMFWPRSVMWPIELFV